MLLFAVVLGIIFGLARKGKLVNISQAPIKAWGLAVAVLVIQIGVDYLAAHDIFWIQQYAGYWYVLSYGLLLLFLHLNRYLPGILVVLAGTLMNLLVIIGNKGHMPINGNYLQEQMYSAFLLRHSATTVLINAGTKFKLLAKLFYLPKPFTELVSIGDIVISVGLVFLVMEVVRGHFWVEDNV